MLGDLVAAEELPVARHIQDGFARPRNAFCKRGGRSLVCLQRRRTAAGTIVNVSASLRVLARKPITTGSKSREPVQERSPLRDGEILAGTSPLGERSNLTQKRSFSALSHHDCDQSGRPATGRASRRSSQKCRYRVGKRPDFRPSSLSNIARHLASPVASRTYKGRTLGRGCREVRRCRPLLSAGASSAYQFCCRKRGIDGRP